MTIADKLTYLSETKDLLANAINGYMQVINADTPFREYAQWVDNILFSTGGGIASLFDEGESGFAWYSLPYHQDPAGTTAATLGNPVGLIEDATDNNADITQATVTARPILGRVPVGGRRNILTRSGFDTQVIGSALPVGWSPEISGGMSTEVIGVGYTDGVSWVDLRIYGVATGATHIRRGYGHSTGLGHSKCFSAYCAVVGGTAAPNSSSIQLTETAVWGTGSTTIPIGEPISRYSVSRTAFSGYDLQPRFGFFHTAGSEYDYVVRIGNTQLEEGVSPTPYQAVTTGYDITESGVPDVFYLRFDGTDDSVSTALPAITNGTVVIAGTNGIWIDDDFNHAGGAFSIGPTSYTNGPERILPIVGDLIVGGCFAIDRQLTAQERTRVINKLKSMGAPGVFELGPELAVNGDFLTDLSGWSTNDGATSATWLAPSDVRVEKAATSAGGIRRPVPVGQGTYLVSGQLIGNDIAGQYAVVRLTAEDIVTILAEGNTLSSPGKSWAVATVPASTVHIYLRKAGAFGSVRWASASMRKLELIP